MNDYRPAMPPEVRTFFRNGKYVFINPLPPAWFVTNDLGWHFMQLFDGHNSIDDIVSIMCDVLGTDQRAQAHDFCSRVTESGIFNTAPVHQPPRDHSLHSVHLSLSDRCNLNCKYCYAAQRTELGGQRLSLDEYRNVIDELTEMSHHITFTITGGEPLLNPLWADVAEYIKAKGARLFLLTNGTLVTTGNVDTIKRLCDLVTISIDGPDAASHALTRGDNYDAVTRAIALFDEHRIDYTLSMTVTRLNIGLVETMARKWGSRLNFAPLFPVSEFAGDNLAITGDEYYNALRNAFGVNPLSYCEAALDASRTVHSLKCAIGDNEISISATGDVYPCQLLHSPQFLAGNVRQTSIKDICRNSDVLRRCGNLSVDDMDKCKQCVIRYICGGACRARGFYETGHIDGNGDFCNYELNAFLDGISTIYSHNVFDKNIASRERN